MKVSTAFRLLAITCVLIVVTCHQVSAQHDTHNMASMSTDNTSMPMTTQKTIMDAKRVGDECMTMEQCTKNLGDLAECKNKMCACKSGSKESSNKMKCNSSGIQNILSVSCLALIFIVKIVV